MKEKDKKQYYRPLMVMEHFNPQEYVAVCTWRATLHCGIYGNSNYRTGSWGNYHYYYEGMEHGTACQNTVVTVRQSSDGTITITGQEVPKGSLLTYLVEPTIEWGRQGVSAPQAPSSSDRGALYSWARWNSNDVNGTGDYIHLGYVASWEDFSDGTSNVS